MKLILHVDNYEKALEAVKAAQGASATPDKVIGIRIGNGTFYSVKRRTTNTVIVYQLKDEES